MSVAIKTFKKIEGWDEFFNEGSSAEKNKHKLLQMARDGKKKPNKKKSAIGKCLYNYTSGSHKCYDKVFHDEIRSLRPDWFEKCGKNYRNLQNLNIQREILDLANGGFEKPKHTTRLGEYLARYLRNLPNSTFSKKIRAIKPEWEATQFDRVKMQKIELLKDAREGKTKPPKATKKGSQLFNYINKKKNSYDKEFVEELRKVNASWLVGRSHVRETYGKELLAMAKEGKPRPKWNTTLGAYFLYLVNKNVDPSFVKEILKQNPDWGSSETGLSKFNKEELLRMAANGEKRPNCKKTKLGRALVCYRCKSSSNFDEEFAKKISEVNPYWFTRKNAPFK